MPSETVLPPMARAIRAAREQASMGQVELAGRLSVRQSAVSQWERGATRPSAGTLLALLEVLPGLAETLGATPGQPQKTSGPEGLPGP